MNDYYKILGVDSGAEKDDIKKAFRRVSRELHPDVGGSVEEFKVLNEAKRTLLDPRLRSIYDSKLRKFYASKEGRKPFDPEATAAYIRNHPFWGPYTRENEPNEDLSDKLPTGEKKT